jgi:CheY-like chemotaxis protein/anti-sigma regulatory factor (Ser/Thr protein kinase)
LAPRSRTFAFFFLGDRQRLQQVLLNLLANAVKYNRDDGLVTVTCAEVPRGQLQIVVTDTGPGMGPESLAHLFTPFERLGAEGSGVEGSGLGLALSKHLVDAMNGTLEAQSEVGVGSRFALALPLVEAPTVEVAPREPPALAASGRGGVVLYIEDNLSNLRLVERMVELLPRTTLLSATQGRLGLELASDRRPDIILLDLHLPDVPGEEVLRQLLAEPRTRQIPVIILSADATPGQIDRLLVAGARAFLTKPIDVRRLLAVLDEQMGAVPRDGAG